MKNICIRLFAAVFGSGLVLLVSAVEGAGISEKVLHSFDSNGTDGLFPQAGLIELNGTLYGTTVQGGTGSGVSCDQIGIANCGTVFSVSRKTGTETVLYSFCSQKNCRDGAAPYASVIFQNGILYGTTSYGGATDRGTVFALDPNTGTETVLHSFGDGLDGQIPDAALTNVNGMLYGTTAAGGNSTGCFGQGCGVAFSLDPNTRAEQVLYSFCAQTNCTDGSAPVASLIDVNGKLYGTTTSGGAFGKGTVFVLDRKTGTEMVVHSFGDGSDGQQPWAGLTNVNGTLYGTTESGGAKGRGTVFAVDPDARTETVLYSFCSKGKCEDGRTPFAGLIEVQGILYGTTQDGGASKWGTVFSLDPNASTEKVVYSFCGRRGCADGGNPVSSLMDENGTLYGTTYSGGAFSCGVGGCGTVFALRL